MQTTTSGTTGMSDKASQNIDRLSSTAHTAVDRVAQVASSSAQRLSEKSTEWMETGDQWLNTTRETVREHPIAALGVAFGIGYLLSKLSR
jgi:ElaB/YqjD/DUF883 family membrane-anchored ribosome-binding protein